MYATASIFCPVASFGKYLSYPNPKNKFPATRGSHIGPLRVYDGLMPRFLEVNSYMYNDTQCDVSLCYWHVPTRRRLDVREK